MADKKDKNEPERRARQPRQEGGGIIKMFGGIVLLGVVAGLGVAYKDQIKALLNKPEEKPPAVFAPPAAPPPPEMAKAPEPIVPIAKPAAPIAKKAVIVDAAPMAKVGAEDALAKKLITAGRNSLEQFDFSGARKLFKEAGAKQAGTIIKNEAKTWELKTEQFAVATKHIDVSEFAVAETSYVMLTIDGSERRGLVRSQDDQTVNFQEIANPAGSGRTTFPIPRSDVKELKAVSKAERRNEFLQLVNGLESNASFQRSADFYDLVFLSKRLGLGHECIGYLDRAYVGGEGHSADPEVGDNFRKEVIRRTIDYCTLMLASGRSKAIVESELNGLTRKKLPGYDVAVQEVEDFRKNVLSKVRDDFKPTLREVKKAAPVVAVARKEKTQAVAAPSAKQLASESETIEFVVDSGGVRGGGAAAPIVDQANAKYDEGMKLYRGFKQGTNGNNNQSLKAAMKSLEEAVSLYDAALQKEPSNKAVLDRQTEANMIVYACKKYQTM